MLTKKVILIFLLLLSNLVLSQKTFNNEQDSILVYNAIDEAKLFGDNGNFIEAERIINEALNFKSVLQNENAKALVLYAKARLLMDKGEISMALELLDQCETIFSKNNRKEYLAKTRISKGQAYKRQLNYSEAIQNFNQASFYFIQENDSIGIALIYLNIGIIYKEIGQFELANQNYFSALKIYENLNEPSRVANCYNNIGNVYMQVENYDSAFYYMRKTLKLRLEYGDKTKLSYIYNNLSNIHLSLNNIDSAEYYVEKSIILKEELNNKTDLVNAYTSRANIAIIKSDYPNALKALEEAKLNLTDDTPLNIRSNLYRFFGDVYLELKDFKHSAENFNQHLIYNDSLEDINKSSGLLIDLMVFEAYKDSVRQEQTRRETELEELLFKNKELTLSNERRKTNFLIISLGIVFVMGILLFISFRRRLKESSKHQKILAEQNQELKRTLISKDEKEVLLKEIHHRVKNNLQIINSLIRLQTNFITPSNFEEKLKDTENRIRSMALIHEKLYQSQNLAKLSIRKYIEELCFTIMESYETKVHINFSFDIEEREFSIDSLIPMGLIINELLSNSIKYAFEGKESGEVRIQMNFDDKNTFLTIADNGMGADLTWDELKEDSLGLELVESLCDQLDGKMKLDTSCGFEFSFVFPPLS